VIGVVCSALAWALTRPSAIDGALAWLGYVNPACGNGRRVVAGAAADQRPYGAAAQRWGDPAVAAAVPPRGCELAGA